MRYPQNFLQNHPNYRCIKNKKTLFYESCLKCNARVVKLVYTLDLGSSAARLGGSSPPSRTKYFSTYIIQKNPILT